MNTDKVLEELEKAMKLDPNAMWALMSGIVPCNKEFAEESFLECGDSFVLGKDQYYTTALGLMNGLLKVLGHQPIAAKFEVDQSNARTALVGYQKYVDQCGHECKCQPKS